MDAYSSYILRLSENRTSELRREAAEYAVSRATRTDRVSIWTRTVARLSLRRLRAVQPVAPIRRTA